MKTDIKENPIDKNTVPKTDKVLKIDRLNNPHDRFAKKTVGNPLYAADFLKHYADPIVARHVHLNHLVAVPTHYLNSELKEIILDVAFTARLRDTKRNSEVLMFLEHKSRPSRFVPLQMGAQCFMFLYFGWTATNYSENYKPSIPLMLLLYNGNEDIDEKQFFQSIFGKIPKEFKRFVPQFKMIVINMKRFSYDNLPGKPETQAIAESFKRATDGTFGTQLAPILERVKIADLGKQHTLDLTTSITRYCTWTTDLTSEKVVQTITKVFTGAEGLKMATTIKKGIVQEGIEIGEARGEARGIALGEVRGVALGEARGELKGCVNMILGILSDRFGKVPKSIVNALKQRTDVVALKSLVVHAVNCSSLDDFAADL
ncbi:MAG: Rpn family recombination-promoting nuclease/putative transposase [Planctomycetaceae bacterium]|nr:Rpn family recombination-promoting nuclease/putative transposase [Planctomycetaceae bacterium]